MADRVDRLRWILLIAAVAVLVTFLLVQKQSTNVSYGQAPAAKDPIPEGSAGELSGATVPSAEQLTAMVKAAPVVRLPGAIATWDDRAVKAAAGGTDLRILVAPPGLPKEARDRVHDVEDATVRVVGTEVSGGILQASADRASEWIRQFATGDVTESLTTLITHLTTSRRRRTSPRSRGATRPPVNWPPPPRNSAAPAGSSRRART